MKITNRIPNIRAQETVANQVPLKPDKFPVRDQFETVNSMKIRDSNLNPPAIPESVQNIVNNREEIASNIGVIPDIPFRENKGGIASRVDKYKGPDTVLQPEIESKVDPYKGPKVVIKEPLIKSRVEEYKGPDSINDFSLPPIPDAVTNIVNNRLDLASKILNTSDTNENSRESQSKGKKKVTVDDLIRHRIENQNK